MRIGIDARMTYYRSGGISRYIRNLVRELEHLRTGHAYTVFHSRKATETISEDFRRANLWTPSHHRVERAALSAELFPHRLDVFHSTDFIPPRRGARYHVITIHDLSFLHYPDFMTAESQRYYVDQIEAAARHADHILTISEASKQDIVRLLGVPLEKITVHLMGADEAFQPQQATRIAEMRAALELPETYFLFVGTFEPRKNIVGLLQGYATLKAAQPTAPSLVIAGRRGWLFDETMAEIEMMQLGDAVLWREGILQSDLPALYSGATALAMPSHYEGFGLPALEAMACGTVPIVSGVSSLPEVVGDVGIQIDPDDPQSIGDALRRAWQDEAWRTKQEAYALRQAASFTWDKTAKTAQEVYERVAGG